jgi:hypothetical protein
MHKESEALNLPSAKDIYLRALQSYPSADVNSLHKKTFDVLVQVRQEYYERRVDEILAQLDLPKETCEKIKKKLLEPVDAKGKKYSNFIEEVSRRISQAFQPLSGQLAELCAQRELESQGLKENYHFTRRKERTDFIIYYPDISSANARHRVEVKNVSLRERAVRGLAFDGDSLFGFFNQLREFTDETVGILEKQCLKTNGYCYIPPNILRQIKYNTSRFRPNTQFGRDMAYFSKNGVFP